MKILLVEDDRITGRALTELLRRRGHQVEWCLTGLAALSSAPGYAPDVIVSDLLLPDLTGVEVIGRMRSLGPLLATVPALLITAAQGATPMLDLLILYKPFKIDELLDAIRRVQERSA